MTKYEIRYNYTDVENLVDEENLVEEFEGDHIDLMDYIREMRHNGCWNIEAHEIYDTEDER